MKDLSEQIERIKSKLLIAKSVDSALRVFGASSHKYQIGQPVDQGQIEAFEEKYSVSLPETYKAFLLYIGNGGIEIDSSAAGPFYGIYPFGKRLGELVYEGVKDALQHEVILSPDMTVDEWQELRDILEDDDLSEEEYVKELGRIYGGIMPLGSQGCTYLYALVINGKHKGKVVNLDQDHQQPKFTFEDHFLDWYERWLDEVINGELLVDNAGWFGYVMGGAQQKLIDTFIGASTAKAKNDALLGLLRKIELSSDTLELLYQNFGQSDKNDKLILQLLVKYKYKDWKTRLIEFAEADLLSVFKFLYWYDRENCKEWLEFIVDKKDQISNSALFHHYLYLLKECAVDYGSYIKNFINNNDKRIRMSTISALGELQSKGDYVDEFILGLQDQSDEVVRSTLFALEGVTDTRLLLFYKKIIDRFPKDQYYILPPLKKRLKTFNVDVEWLKSQNF